MRAATLAVLGILLAGCAGAPAPTPDPSPTPSVITDPAQGLDDPGAHIHDYWNGQDRLTVADLTHPGGGEPGTGPGLAGGEDVVVRSFVPDSGNVVPQGTAAVEVTFTWRDADLDAYGPASLWLKTAASNQTQEVAALENGVPVTIETGAPDADLPHQLLSAWLFELRMDAPEPAPLRFKGEVDLRVDALRGLPLPVFPAHPDRWNGTTQLPLLEAEGELSYWEDTGDGGCNGLSCPQVLRPASGAVVPHDATLVRVTLATTRPADAPALVLRYHSGLSRDFETLQATASGAQQVYDIPVGQGGDGPYATQSQWEFSVVPEQTGPVRTAWMAQYTLTAVAVR